MPELDSIIDFLSATFVIIIISIFVTLAWMSTYVRDQPIVATAVVVFQQEAVPNNSSMENRRETPERGSTVQATECETADTVVSHESESNQSTANREEVKLAAQASHIPENIDTTSNKPEENETKNNEATDNVGPSCQAEETVIASCIDESSSIPEVESCCSTDNVLRKRRHDEAENYTVQEKVNENKSDTEINSKNEGIHCEDCTEDSIRIKLKFLDDTQRLVRGQLTDEVGNFKRANFNPELSSNRVVRLIFNGQLLNRDHSTLGQYGLFDNCVVHCHISQPQPSNVNERSESSLNQDNDGLDLSEILSPLLLLIVAFLWYLRYEYSHIFNTSATIVLVCLTALLLISQYALVISFNISLGYEGDNGNNSSNSGSRSSNRINTDSTPHIQPNANASTAQTPSTEATEEEVVPDRSVDSSQADRANVSDTQSRPVSLRRSFVISNHIPNSISSILSR